MIKVEHLVKRYGNRNVVDDLTFTVEKGQIVGFLGPNGAGKSTTMNMITGYISATEGTIEIDGVDIFDEPEKAKKKIGYLPEIIVPFFAGKLLDGYGEGGYKYLFITIVVLMVIGIVMLRVWDRYQKNMKK